MGLQISRKNGDGEEILCEIAEGAEGKAAIQYSPAGTRESEIAAGSNYAVPAYVVGSGRLQVFLDGVLCAGGTEADVCAYMEIGTSGAPSTTIQFHQAIATDYEILVRVQ